MRNGGCHSCRQQGAWMTVELFASRTGRCGTEKRMGRHLSPSGNALSFQVELCRARKYGESCLRPEGSVGYRKGACLKFRHRYVCAHSAVPVAYIREIESSTLHGTVCKACKCEKRVRRPGTICFSSRACNVVALVAMRRRVSSGNLLRSSGGSLKVNGVVRIRT